MINRLNHPAHLSNPVLDQKGGKSWEGGTPERDVFQPDRGSGLKAELAFREAARLMRAEQLEMAKGGESVSNFPNRNGYSQDFLGKPLPLPQMDAAIRDKAAPLIDQPDKFVLDYTNFSIVMNKERRQPIFTAANIDGSKLVDIPRDGEWTLDGRIRREHQLGNEAYQSNPIDRGHMVRRSDPAWGPQAHQASNDTFAYTNAAMQHEALNQKEWLELENHVLGTAKALGDKLTVMTGPVLREDDPLFDNHGAIKPPTRMPMKFWKMVVWNSPKEGLKGAAFVLSQEDFVKGDLMKAEFKPDRFKVYQVPIQKLEEMTHLRFGQIVNVTEESRELTAADGYRPTV